MKEGDDPHWFSIIADEATDIINSEQLNISIRWVNNTYDIREDSIGLCRVPNTSAHTLYTVIKDALIRCNLLISLCQGQAYDSATTMLGKKSTRFLKENAAAIPIHCCTHSLNLCLQDAGRKLVSLRDALETVREISNLIHYSPKRSHLFSTKLLQEENNTSCVQLKSLCLTRWTARTGAIDAIIKDYSLLLESLEEIHASTKDEYGLKTGGLLQSLEKFNTLFGIKLSYLIFSAAEQVSLTLQKKTIVLQEALVAVGAAKAYLTRIRSDDNFNLFYEEAVKFANDHKLSAPELPRFRRRPA